MLVEDTGVFPDAEEELCENSEGGNVDDARDDPDRNGDCEYVPDVRGPDGVALASDGVGWSLDVS